jgi:hypothetical protein
MSDQPEKAVSSPESAAKFTAKHDRVASKYNYDGAADPQKYDEELYTVGTRKVSQDAYPYQAFDPEDTRGYADKLKYLKEANTTLKDQAKVEPTVYLSEDDIQEAKRRHDLQEHDNYKAFVYNFFDRKIPYQQALLEKVAPDILKSQRDLIRRRAKIQKRLAMLKLQGFPKDKKDLYLLYALRTGAIDKANLLKGLLEPNPVFGGDETKKRGLLNPKAISSVDTKYGDNVKFRNWATPNAVNFEIQKAL